MFEDLGAVASGAVKNLRHYKSEKGWTTSFQVAKKQETQKALHDYIGISLEIMGGFFREYGPIDLAFLARERDGR